MKVALIFLLFFYIFSPKDLVASEICGLFHKNVAGKCTKFDVPSNAHLTYSGNSWDCNRGFKRSQDNLSCEEIKIPKNASGNFIGGFYCNSGYKQIGDQCKKISNILNGRFYEFGANFYCNSGYFKSKDSKNCLKNKIPENAFEDFSSLEGWNCFRGYVKQGTECKKFELPEHAVWFPKFWGCEPGFKKNINANSCEKVIIAENGYPVDTFEGWLCNKGFRKNYHENRCDKIN